MKKYILAVAFIVTSPFVVADESREKAIGELEAKSVSLRIDVSNHINSIQEKYKALPKERDGLVNGDGFDQVARSVQKRTSEMLTNASVLKRETFSLMESAGNDITFFGSPDSRRISAARVSVVLREVLCTEFALNLVIENTTTLFAESVSLANTVLNECKVINDGQRGSGRPFDPVEARRPGKKETKLPTNRKK